jgi:hypothetical protein
MFAKSVDRIPLAEEVSTAVHFTVLKIGAKTLHVLSHTRFTLITLPLKRNRVLLVAEYQTTVKSV